MITINCEAIKANKAVALYYDLENVPHYIYDTAHGQLKIDEPFTAIYNSGQIWKFTDIELLSELVFASNPGRFTGTNLVLINEYFQKLAKNSQTIDIISMKTWINCNTVNDFITAGL